MGKVEILSGLGNIQTNNWHSDEFLKYVLSMKQAYLTIVWSYRI